jgi:CRP-like cAMP-binding protein
MLVDEHVKALAAVPLFKDLAPDELAEVASHVMVQEYGTGRQLVSEGNRAAAFYLIVDGTAGVEVHGSPRRTLSPGDYFGELAVIDEKPRSANVFAMSPITALVIGSWDFMPMLEHHWSITKHVLRHLCDRVRELDQTDPR